MAAWYKVLPRPSRKPPLNDAHGRKADIIAQAFLGQKLGCARCHDAPFILQQKDLFSPRDMNGKALKRRPPAPFHLSLADASPL